METKKTHYCVYVSTANESVTICEYDTIGEARTMLKKIFDKLYEEKYSFAPFVRIGDFMINPRCIEIVGLREREEYNDGLSCCEARPMDLEVAEIDVIPKKDKYQTILDEFEKKCPSIKKYKGTFNMDVNNNAE